MLKLVLLLFAIATVYGQQYSAVAVGNNRLRAYSLTELPVGAPKFVSLTGVAAQVGLNNAVLDIAQFNFTTINQTTLSFAYLHGAQEKNAQGVNTQIEELFLAIRALAAFEFINNDGVPGFQLSNGTNADQIIRWYDLSNPQLPWNPIQLSSVTITGPGGNFKVNSLTATTADNVFEIQIVVADQPITVDGVEITPDKAKINVGIRWYNPLHVVAAWTNGPSPNGTTNAQVGFASVALSAAVFAGFHNGSTNANAPTGSSLAFGSGIAVGNFSWSPTANVTANGLSANGVVYAHVTDQSIMGGTQDATVVGEFSFKFVFFSFEGFRPDFVFWDPVAGGDINYAALTPNSGNSLVYSFVALFAAIVIALHSE